MSIHPTILPAPIVVEPNPSSFEVLGVAELFAGCKSICNGFRTLLKDAASQDFTRNKFIYICILCIHIYIYRNIYIIVVYIVFFQ